MNDEQRKQYAYLCDEYDKWVVDMYYDLLGPNELFDGIVMELEEYYDNI